MSRLRPETALRAVLLDNAELTAATAGRIYRGTAEQKGGRPYGIFARVRTESHQNLEEGATGLKEVDVMYSWCGRDFDALEEVADLCELVLDGFRGDVEVAGNEVRIEHCFLLDDRDGDIQNPDGSEQPIYCIEQIYRVAYKAI